MTIDNKTKELLLDAVVNDDFTNIKTLIKSGLDINVILDHEENLLHQCFIQKKYQLSQHIILHGINLTLQNNLGRTPLHFASRSGFYEGVHLLTLLTQDINQQDHKGRIPLMHAIKYKQVLLIKILMARGSDTDIKDKNGYPSLLWAIKFLNAEELKAIMSADVKDKLAEQAKQAIEQDSLTLQVSDSLVELAQEVEEQESEEDEYILPNYLKLAIGEKDTTEHVAEYSITEYIESLKSKAEEEGFPYEIAPLEKLIDRPELVLNMHEIMNATKRQQQEEVTIDMTMPANADDARNSSSEIDYSREDEKSSREDYESTYTKEKIARADIEINLLQQEELNRANLNDEVKDHEEVFKRKDVDLKLEKEDKEKAKKENEVKEDDVQVITGKRQDLVDKETQHLGGKGYVEKISSHTTTIRERKASEKEGKTIVKDSGFDPNNEKQKIKHAEVENNTEDTNSDKTTVEEMSQDGIVIKKKVIKHIRDGYKEEYNDKLASIRTVDKNISSDEMGAIKTVDKNISNNELGDIKTVDKRVGAYDPYESYTKKLSGQDDTTTVTGDEETNNEIQEIKRASSETYSRDSEKEARPELNINIIEQEKTERTSTNIQDNDQEDIYKREKNETASEGESESYLIVKDKNKNAEEIIITLDKKEKKEDEILDLGRTSTDKEKSNPNQDISEDDLLDHIVDANQKNGKGQSLVWLAAQKGQTNMVKRLILKGADYETKDKEGFSCFMIAAICGHHDIVEYLSEKVRNIDEKRTDGQTALSLAVEHNQASIIQLLVDKGAKLDTKLKGNDLLMHAAGVGATESIKTLILLGANPHAKNFKGKKAIDIAKANRKKKAYELLQSVMKGK